MLGYRTVPFTEAHLDAGVALSRAAGWPHRREDWAMMLPLSRGVAALQGDRVVGTAFRTDFGPRLSAANMIIVAEEMRGRGLGRALMQSAMGETPRAFRLVATAPGRPLYESLGFVEVGRVAQVQGVVADVPDLGGAEEAEAGDLPAIAALESASYGGDRAALVDLLRREARMAVTRQGARVTGYAACRQFGRGHVIGPVVAGSETEARALVAHLARPLVSDFLRLDVTVESGLGAWLTGLALDIVDVLPVMERGGVSAGPERRALFSQALG